MSISNSAVVLVPVHSVEMKSVECFEQPVHLTVCAYVIKPYPNGYAKEKIL